MKTVFALAASAMVLVAGSQAFAADQHVKVRGRTDAAIHADIVAAATSICHEQLGAYAPDVVAYCVRDVTLDAVKKVHSPTLTAYDKAAFRPSGLQKISY